MTDTQRDAMREAFYALFWAAQDLVIYGHEKLGRRPLAAARGLAVILDGEFAFAEGHAASYVYAIDSYERVLGRGDGAEKSVPLDAPGLVDEPARVGVPLSALIVAADLVRPELVDLR